MLLITLLGIGSLATGVWAAPTKIEKRDVPAGVPDYVLKYGKYEHKYFSRYLLGLVKKMGLLLRLSHTASRLAMSSSCGRVPRLLSVGEGNLGTQGRMKHVRSSKTQLAKASYLYPDSPLEATLGPHSYILLPFPS